MIPAWPALLSAALLVGAARLSKTKGSRLSVPPYWESGPPAGPRRAEVEDLVANGYGLEEIQDLYPEHIFFPDDDELEGFILRTSDDGPVLVRMLEGEIEITGV